MSGRLGEAGLREQKTGQAEGVRKPRARQGHRAYGLLAYAQAEVGRGEFSEQLTGRFSKQGWLSGARRSLSACWSCSQAAELLGSGPQGGA